MTEPASLKTFLWYASDLEGALNFYKETFRDVVVKSENRMGDALFTAEFSILGHDLVGMSVPGGETFNDSISLAVSCDGQEETDRLWDAITKEGTPGKCGWCKDKWGVSWQVIPRQMNDFMSDPDPEKAQYAWQAMRGMTKIILADFTK